MSTKQSESGAMIEVPAQVLNTLCNRALDSIYDRREREVAELIGDAVSVPRRYFPFLRKRVLTVTEARRRYSDEVAMIRRISYGAMEQDLKAVRAAAALANKLYGKDHRVTVSGPVARVLINHFDEGVANAARSPQ